MLPRESVDGARRARRVRSNGAAHAHAPVTHGSFRELVESARLLPKKIQREMSTRPAVVLATVGGAAFLAGAVLGSRLGRAVLSAAIPVGLQHLVETELGPRLWSYMADLTRKADTAPVPA